MGRYLWVLLALFLVGCMPIEYDPAYHLDPAYVLKAAGVDANEYIDAIKAVPPEHAWARADYYLLLARLENARQYYQKACEEFNKVRPQTAEQRALLLESMASLNCDNNKALYLQQAALTWHQAGVGWRVALLQSVMDTTNKLQFDTTTIEPKLNLSGSARITLGTTTIIVEDGDKVVTQVDRVYRDWLGRQVAQTPFAGELLVTFSERLTYSEDELRSDIGWHEGGRARDLQNALDVSILPVSGTVIAKHEDKWYAPDENGVFRFEVPLDKVSYPTTRFFSADIGMIVDTHGVNMLVEQAIRNDADVVLSDCDHEGKTKAAVYLSHHNIPVICFPDRFLYRALGHDAQVVGSPVWRLENGKMIYGNAPITLEKEQKVVVADADIGKTYAIWYYSTPMLYFKEVAKTFPLEIIPAVLDDFEQSEKVFAVAREHEATVVATRVFNSYDYEQAKKWLEEDKEHKIILFHSTMYPYGIVLMQEFPEQISFDDPNIEQLK